MALACPILTLQTAMLPSLPLHGSLIAELTTALQAPVCILSAIGTILVSTHPLVRTMALASVFLHHLTVKENPQDRNALAKLMKNIITRSRM